MIKKNTIVPILLILFNRPDKTKILFEALSATGMNLNLHVHIDGPRVENQEDSKKVDEVKGIVNHYKSIHNINTHYQINNLGCRDGVRTALLWFYNKNEVGIILEDDCIPALGFIEYMSNELENNKNKKNIGVISGHNHFSVGSKLSIEQYEAYEPSKYADIWGWGSYSKVILPYINYNLHINQKEIRNTIGVIFKGRILNQIHWNHFLDKLIEGKLITWDVELQFYLWSNNLNAVIPKYTLIENIGIGLDATNMKSGKSGNERVFIKDDLKTIADYEKAVERYKQLISLSSIPRLIRWKITACISKFRKV